MYSSLLIDERIKEAWFWSKVLGGATASFTGTSDTPTLGSTRPVFAVLSFEEEFKILPVSAVADPVISKVVLVFFTRFTLLSSCRNVYLS